MADQPKDSLTWGLSSDQYRQLEGETSDLAMGADPLVRILHGGGADVETLNDASYVAGVIAKDAQNVSERVLSASSLLANPDRIDPDVLKKLNGTS